VSVLLGNGNGTFAAKRDYETGDTPRSVALGDLNGDGKPDIVTANFSSNTVSVLLGNGNGTFAAKRDYETGRNPRSVALGDLNGDGKPDMAVTNVSSDTVSVLLGNGNGTFAATVDYGTGIRPISVAVGDFNGDGKPDLAVANYNSDTVSVLLNVAERVRVSGSVILQGIVPSAPSQLLRFTSRADGQADFVRDVAVAPNGLFLFLLPKRNGTLTIKGDKYLAKRINLNTTGGAVSGLTALLRAGDANNDNAADIADLLVLIAAYNKVSPALGYHQAADFNFDGANDITDLLLLIGNYNQMGD